MNANERPKPGPFKTKEPPTLPLEVVELPKGAAKPKPKFVLKPHLTDRPFLANEAMQEFKAGLEKQTTPRRGQRRTNKEKK